jgi:hypothetical protein
VDNLNVFILEDDLSRLKLMIPILDMVFDKPLIYSAETVENAKQILQKGLINFDLICLDHDLGGEHFVPSTEANTGYQLAKYIKDNKIGYKKCIIHSMNYAGAMNMQQVLKDAKYLPIVLWNEPNIKFIWGN